ncbi:MAG TPA: DUF5678 domain-containing protein [bacterium]|nr:DUF5678 domain-containing protein [bacterium]
MQQVLAKGKKYSGKYVALQNFANPKVVGYGETPEEARNKALHKGFKHPVIAFVPSKTMVQIY